MTPNQNKVLKALNQADDWMVISTLAKLTGIDYRVVYKTLESPVFKDIETGYQHMKVMNRSRDVKVFRIKRVQSNTTEALDLAKKHTGMFGQLLWSKNGNA